MKVATVTNTYALLTSVSFLGMEDTTEEVLIWPTSHPKIIEAASVICRLMDDIVGTEVYLNTHCHFYSAHYMDSPKKRVHKVKHFYGNLAKCLFKR